MAVSMTEFKYCFGPALSYLIAALLLLASTHATADIDIPLYEKGTDVFYLEAFLEGYGQAEFMLDTGSGPAALASDVLLQLKNQGKAVFSHQGVALLANGQQKYFQVYYVDSLLFGNDCMIKNFEAAELPAGTRNIIGINLLKRAAPFSIKTNPSILSLEGCSKPLTT